MFNQANFHRLILIISLMFAGFSWADSKQFESDWTGWVQAKHKNLNCPYIEASKLCLWVGHLRLDLHDKGLSFTLPIESFREEGGVQLPGDKTLWPVKVFVNEKKASVVDKQGLPYIYTTKGSFVITGEFSWQKQPPSIRVPDEVFLLSLYNLSKRLPLNRSGNKVLLGRTGELAKVEERNSVDIEVYRKLIDSVPVVMLSRISLRVSGKPREIEVGRASISQAELMQLSSILPAKLESNGNLRVQVKPGQFTIELKERFVSSPTTISVRKQSSDWPKHEYISFQSNTDIRQLKLSGAVSIDTSQVLVPRKWRSLPTYRLDAQNLLTIETLKIGDTSPVANNINIQRNLWLDFDGKSLTALDVINGKMSQNWRLNTAQDTALGRATVANNPVLITDDKGSRGIEIRSHNIDLKAVSRVNNPANFSAIGWKAKVDSYSAKLHLPPGWRVISATGLEKVNGSWLDKWDLWDIFLVLIIIATTNKLLGRKTAAIAAATLLLSYHERGAPIVIWPILLLVIALLPLIKNGLLKFISTFGVVTAVVLLLMIVSFAVDQFRLAIYPTLERHGVGDFQYSSSYDSVNYDFSDNDQQDQKILTKKVNQKRLRYIEQEGQVDRYNNNKQKVDFYAIDENDRIQTGPGLPTWTWNFVNFIVTGPVSPGQTVTVIYASPLITSIWRVINVMLIALLSLLLFSKLLSLIKVSQVFKLKGKPVPASMLSITVIFTLLIIGFVTNPQKVYADNYPPEYLIKQLEKQLTEKPECIPECASLNNGFLKANKNKISLNFEINATVDVAVKIPQWNWSKVTVDSEPALVRNYSKIPYIFAKKGYHKVNMSGQASSEQESIVFPSAIHNFSVESTDWTIDGVVDHRIPNGTIHLHSNNKATTSNVDSLLPDPILPFVIVHRTLVLEETWRIITRVERLAPNTGAITVNVPLVLGEKVLSDLFIKGESAVIQLGANEKSKTWHSSVEPKNNLELVAATKEYMLETWRVQPSSLWRVEYKGIPRVKQQGNMSTLQPLWRPWFGEKLFLSVSRPKGINGPVQTIEKAGLIYTAGKRIQHSKLDLSIRASQGEDYEITIPKGAEILSLISEGRELNIPIDNKIIVPLQPGLQKITVEFNETKELDFISKTPEIILPGNATNITIGYKLPRDRWHLYVDGPAIGPAMLYWGVLCVILIGAVLLAVLKRKTQLDIPVNLFDWLLLGLGLSTVNSYGVIIAAGLFFMMALRKKYLIPQSLNRIRFNSLQFLLVTLTGVALLVLLSAIPMGLLSTPNMNVVGNESHAYMYSFYQDRATAGEFPLAHVVNIPLIAYRIAMLVWSLWLATRLLKWSVWWWDAFTSREAWRPKVKDLISSNNK